MIFLKDNFLSSNYKARSGNAILIADLDHFKAINDRYEHHLGDLVLQHNSQIFKENLREYDKVSRIGGEEFVVILHNTHRDTGLNIVERIRESLEHSPMTHDMHHIYLTMSIGVSFFDTHQEIDRALLEADAQLYLAKQQGRNRVQSLN